MLKMVPTMEVIVAGVVVLVQLQEVLREMQQAPLLAGRGALGALAGWGAGNSIENSINNGGEPDWGRFTPMGDCGGGSSSISGGREKGGGDSGGRGNN